MNAFRLNNVLHVACVILVLLCTIPASSYAQTQQLYEAFKGNRSGLIDVHGDWVLKPRFDSIDEVEYHHIYFYEGAMMGIASMRGKILVQPRWQHLMSVRFGLARAIDERGTTYISIRNGKRICDYYKELSVFIDGLAVMQDSNGKWGAIDQYGRRILPCRYDSLEYFERGKARAWMDGKSFFIDREGREVEAPNEYLAWRFYPRNHFIKDDKWGAVNSKGDTVFQPVYDDLCYAAYYNTCAFSKDGKYGLADTGGNILIAPRYDYLGYFDRHSVNAACLDGKWGLINLREEAIAPFEFDAMHDLYTNDEFAASAKGKWGVLDKSGSWTIAPRFERIRESFEDADEPREENDEDDDEVKDNVHSTYPCVFSLPKNAGSGSQLAGQRMHIDCMRSSGQEIKTFPNPTKGRFVIELPEAHPATYKLYDTKGSIVLSGNITNRTAEADISSLPAGAYMLVVSCNEQNTNLRITKQ